MTEVKTPHRSIRKLVCKSLSEDLDALGVTRHSVCVPGGSGKVLLVRLVSDKDYRRSLRALERDGNYHGYRVEFTDAKTGDVVDDPDDIEDFDECE